MQDHVGAVMLAGTILPTPFQEALGIPVLCLPIGPAGCVLDAWVRALATIPNLSGVKLVVKSPTELERVSAAIRGMKRNGAKMNIQPQREPGAWRGVAGLLRDLRDYAESDDLLLVLEAHSCPPTTLTPLIDAIKDRPDVVGVIGTSDRGEPVGASIFRSRVFDCVPAIGYCDLKEQLLPALHERGEKVIVQRLSERVQRMRDLQSYLKAVRSSLKAPVDIRHDQVRAAAIGGMRRIAAQASVSPRAIIDGFCIIEPDAVIEDGAVLHDCVVLKGAVVGGGAVVSCSVLGPTVRVKPRDQIVHDLIPTPSDRLGDVMELIENAAGVSAA